VALDEHDRSATQERNNCHAEEEAVVALDGIAQPGQVAENGGQHGASTEYAASPFVAAGEQADGSQQFPNPLPPSPPRLSSHFAEDVFRFWCACELEEQCLNHDPGCDQGTNPGYDMLLAS